MRDCVSIQLDDILWIWRVDVSRSDANFVEGAVVR